MSSEKPAKSGRYAPYYLMSRPDVSDVDWLLTFIQAEAEEQALDLTGNVAPLLAPRVRQVVNAAGMSAALSNLPFADVQFDLVIYQHPAVTQAVDDVFEMMREAARMLKPGGQIIVQDLGLPDDERAAQYVDAFCQFRDCSQHRSLAIYEWQGVMLDAGLQVLRTDTMSRPVRLAEWAAGSSPYVAERLTVLLQQAPATVADHLRPFAIGTPDAMFTQTMVTVVGQKPLA